MPAKTCTSGYSSTNRVNCRPLLFYSPLSGTNSLQVSCISVFGKKERFFQQKAKTEKSRLLGKSWQRHSLHPLCSPKPIHPIGMLSQTPSMIPTRNGLADFRVGSWSRRRLEVDFYCSQLCLGGAAGWSHSLPGGVMLTKARRSSSWGVSLVI